MKERFGERIRRERAEHKLGLRETATKVGISPTYLSRIETMHEQTPPAEDVIRKLATLLNDDFDLLMQLAGRVPEDVEKIIKGDPSMSAALRTTKERKISGDDLMKLLEAEKKGRQRRQVAAAGGPGRCAMSPPSARRDAAVISARAALWATDAPREARSRARAVTGRVPALRGHGWPAREAWAARVAHAYRVLVSVQGDRRRGEP